MSGKEILGDVRHALDAVPLDEAGRRQIKELFVVQVDVQDVSHVFAGGRPYPAMRYQFFGLTEKEARKRMVNHKLADPYFAGAFKGAYKKQKLLVSRLKISKVQVAELKLDQK